MEFSDQSHIERVRDALHEPSEGAVVMVGSGFSRNAVSKRPSVISAAYLERTCCGNAPAVVSPKQTGGITAQARQTMRQPVTSLGWRRNMRRPLAGLPCIGTLRARDSRRGLRAGRCAPATSQAAVAGCVHDQLGHPPWSGRLLPLWNTITASCGAQKRSRSRPGHALLSCTDRWTLEVSTHLHGRGLPDLSGPKFAPFVNTVQQAMMENLVLLIGFSGDDPNFLHWSGWVRDNLGASAPKIYLAGWLELTACTAAACSKAATSCRSISPDIRKLDEWSKHPRHVRHANATEWILRSLKYGQPYDIYNWPSTPKSGCRGDSRGTLQPLPTKVISVPRAEPEAGS